MPINPFKANEESSFEQGISINKPAKAVTAQSQQQAKKFQDDFVNQLYGFSDKSTQGDDQADPATANQPKPTPPPPPPKQVHKLGGMSDSGDHAKYAAMQALLEKGDKKGADDAMHHMQYYYDTTIGTLEEQVKKARQKTQQDRQEKEKQEQEDDDKKKQEMAEKSQDLPQATGKGRNRMGKKPKTDMGLKMGQMKTETFRGSSG
ncbi:MAG TPA: hypothetical protein VM077_02935 [Candidatus Limnocylindrales bacterium]|nr:hypothetical protein [Candidatus Limnocylindrales bacterium]